MIIFQLNFIPTRWNCRTQVRCPVGRLWDAFFDPMMGVTRPHKHTLGQPPGLVVSRSLASLCFAYTTPDYSTTGKIVWACVTNTLLMTPIRSTTRHIQMTGVMTGNINERTSSSSYRFVPP